MVRRGADLVLEGVWDLANAEFSWRDRFLPLSGDKEGMFDRAITNLEPHKVNMVQESWGGIT